jgi:putative redox protein
MSSSATIEATLNRVNGLSTMLTNGRHRWVADVPKTLGSDDTAPDPHDLLDSALAACTVLTLELYLKRKPDWQVDRIQCRVVRMSETRGEDGKLDYQLKRLVKVEGGLTPEQEGRLIEIANKCPIHRLLEGRTHIETALDLD